MVLNEQEKIILINLLNHELEYTEEEICNTHDRQLEKYFYKLEDLTTKLKESL